MITHKEIEDILAEHAPGAVSQHSLQYGIQGILACISNDDRSRELGEWFPLSDDRETVINKAKEFARRWAEGDQPK